MLNAIDRFVGFFSPGKALKRIHSRLLYNHIRNNEGELERKYEAARVDRLNKGWRPSNMSADLSLQGDADVVRAKARDLVENNAYAKGILRAAVRNIVGPGIRPQSMVDMGDSDASEQTRERIEAVWDRWQMQADVTGHLSFYEMQQLIVSERWEAGEILVQFVESSDPNRVVPFALELIDIDRLASDHWFPRNQADNGNEVRRGVELDATGRAVAYWLYPYHPNDINATQVRPVRHDAENFIHIFKRNRAGQTRGISELAPVVRWLKNLDRYMDNELTSSTIASCFSVAIKTISAGADGGIGGPSSDDGSDDNGNGFEYLEPGIVARLFPDEEIQVIDPSRRQSDAISWLTFMQRAIGVGTGLSYERLTRDYSQTNYSSNRASDLEDRREFRMEQQAIIRQLCIPVWNRFMAACVQKRVYGFPDKWEAVTDWDNWTNHSWNPPGWEWVDPLKEVKATTEALNNNLTTLAEENQKRDGGDWRARLRQRGLEKKIEAENGLTPETTEPKRLTDEQAEETALDESGKQTATA